MPLGNLYPRNVSVYGTEKMPCAVLASSLPQTSGALVFITPQANDYYIYMDGNVPRFGGVTEVMTNPAGGVALGAAVVPGGWDQDKRIDGVSQLGTDRVSSSVAIVSNGGYAPALGLMFNKAASIEYLYVVTGNLCIGDETAWLAGTIGTPLATITGSGTLDVRRDGRTVIGNNRSSIAPSLPNAMVIASGGKGAAFGFAWGDYSVVTTMYYDGTALKFDNAANWWTWTNS
jgi:hypothetical protein